MAQEGVAGGTFDQHTNGQARSDPGRTADRHRSGMQSAGDPLRAGRHGSDF
jgi:hypothetical protein